MYVTNVITIKLLAMLEKVWILVSIREIDISADIMAATCPALLCNEYLITFEYRREHGVAPPCIGKREEGVGERRFPERFN